MGIERFFNSLMKNKTIRNNDGEFVLQTKVKTDYMFIDFNSILYKIASEIEEELNFLLYDIIYKKNNTYHERTREIAKKWKYSIGTIETFKKHFTDDVIDTYSVTLVKKHLHYITSEVIDGTVIRRIMIAMDGIPNMGKLVEQRKRRYNLYIINKLKKEIYAEHRDKLDAKRRLFEDNKIGYNRNKILAWHSFMKCICECLNEKTFLDEMKEKYPMLEEFIFSGANIPGEGEKKIMEYIVTNNLVGKHVIYSPDSDVIILSMILANKLLTGKFYMMHFEQNKKEYTVMDINELIKNIYEFVKTKVDDKFSNKLDRTSILNDLSMLFTMFGNDFLPKIESLDVRNDFGIIIAKYCEVLNDSTNAENMYYIINDSKINFSSLRNFIKKMGDVEKYLIKDTYMAHNYNNYKKLRENLKVNNLFVWMQNYIINVNELFDNVYLSGEVINKESPTETTFHSIVDREVNNIYNEYVDEVDFINDFLLIEANKKHGELLVKTQFMDKLKSYYHFVDGECKINIKFNLRLSHFDEDIGSKFHTEQLEKLKIIDTMELTDYDREIYALEHMMGVYKKKLNAVNNNIGTTHLIINRKTPTRKYYQLISASKKANENPDYLQYYSLYFNTTPDSDTVNKLCEDYLSGLFWVFDFYFNKNDAATNYSFVSTWFYSHHRAPLLRELASYLITEGKDNAKDFVKKMNNLNNNALIQVVNRESFLNTREQYFYITPQNNITAPTPIIDAMKSNETLFPNLDIIVTKIKQTEISTPDSDDKYDETLPIDCTSALYINKCNLMINPVSYTDFIKVVIPLRNLYTITKAAENPIVTKFKHTNKKHEDGNIEEMHNIISKMSRQSQLRIKKLYKDYYLKSGNYAFKTIYKMAKNFIDAKYINE